MFLFFLTGKWRVKYICHGWVISAQVHYVTVECMVAVVCLAFTDRVNNLSWNGSKEEANGLFTVKHEWFIRQVAKLQVVLVAMVKENNKAFNQLNYKESARLIWIAIDRTQNHVVKSSF